MKKITTIQVTILVLTITAFLSNAQTFEWARSFSGTSVERGYAIAVDGNGNVYTTGTLGGTADFDPSPTGTSTLSTAGADDIFVSKLDVTGNFVWAKRIGGSSTDQGRALSTDVSGNVYVAGLFSGTVDFDPSPSVFTLSVVTPGANDAFICKLDAAGNFVWAKSFSGIIGSGGQSRAYSLKIDASGNIYTTGYFTNVVDFDPSSIATTTLSSTGSSQDIFVSKLDASGNFLWAKKMGSTGIDVGNGITVDASGNVLTTGYFSTNADFDPGAGTMNLTNAGGFDAFVSKLDASGNFVWAGAIRSVANSSGYDIGNAIVTDANNNVYVSGFFVGVTDFDPSPSSTYTLSPSASQGIYLSKLDASGNFIWAKNTGGGGSNVNNDQPTGLAIDPNSNLYLSGFFTGFADFDPSPSSSFTLNAAFQSIYISKFDASGNFAWVSSVSGNSGLYGFSVAVDGIGKVHCTGVLNGTADFDPSATTNFTLTSTALQDIFVLKLGCTPEQPGAISGSTLICAGANSAYSIAPVSGAATYSWSFPSGWNGTSSITAVSATAIASGTVGVAALNSCGSSPQRTIMVTVNPAPTITVNSGTICAGGNFVFLPNGASSYTISGGSFTVSPNSNSSYSITGTNSLGCLGFAAVGTILVNSLPNLTLSASGSTICSGENVTVTVSGASTYTWSTNISSATIIVAPIQNTTYSVQGNDNNGCGTIANIAINVTECTSYEVPAGKNITTNLFPNPNNGCFVVEAEPDLPIQLTNSVGQIVYATTSTTAKTSIDLTSLPNGIYSVLIGTKTKKIIKE